MTNFLKNFARDESGAVTVDYVVLCAAVVGLGIAVIGALSGSLSTAATTVGASIGTAVDDEL